MAKSSSRYVCQDCGAVQPKWAGKCEACGAWNTLIEEVVEAAAPKGLKPGGGRRLSFVELDGQTSDAPRRVTGIGEFDRSEEHTSELQSLMRISYAVFCLKKK